MTELAILLVTAGAGYGLSQWLRLPVIPFLLALGILLSIIGLAPERESAKFLVQFGLAFLVFHAGIELNPRRFLRQTKSVVWVAAGQFALVGLGGYLIARQMGLTHMGSLYMALATAASSTLVVVRQLKTQQQMFQPFGRLVTGVLLIQDAALILAIVILSRIGEGTGTVLASVGALIGMGGAAYLVHAYVLPWFERVVQPDEETLLLVALSLLFIFVGVAGAVGLPVIAGAFLAGFTLSVFPLNGLVRGLLGSLAEFFQAIFFAALGSLVVFSSMWIIPQSLVFALLVLLITPPIVTFLAEWQGQSSRNAIESGLLLAQTSELSLILGIVGIGSGYLSIENFSVVVLTCVLTMTLTPFLATDGVTWKLMHWHPGRQGSQGFAGFENHAILIGFGSSGMWVVKELQEGGMRVLVIDEDASVIASCERNRIACLRGDGSDPKLLSRAGLRESRLVIANLPRPADVLKVIHFAEGTPVVARVFESTDARRISEAGGYPVLSSEAALKKFLLWFAKTDIAALREKLQKDRTPFRPAA